MDGHDTHEKPEIQHMIYDCLDNEDLEIMILCFPSKTTTNASLLMYWSSQQSNDNGRKSVPITLRRESL